MVVDEQVAVVIRVEGPGDGELPEVVQAGRSLRPAFGGAERGQEQARQNRDDRDDDEQFDEGEAASRAHPAKFPVADCLFFVHEVLGRVGANVAPLGRNARAGPVSR